MVHCVLFELVKNVLSKQLQCVFGVVVSVLGWRQFVAGSSLAPYVVAPLALESGLKLHHLMQLDGRPSS